MRHINKLPDADHIILRARHLIYLKGCLPKQGKGGAKKFPIKNAIIRKLQKADARLRSNTNTNLSPDPDRLTSFKLDKFEFFTLRGLVKDYPLAIQILDQTAHSATNTNIEQLHKAAIAEHEAAKPNQTNP